MHTFYKVRYYYSDTNKLSDNYFYVLNPVFDSAGISGKFITYIEGRLYPIKAYGQWNFIGYCSIQRIGTFEIVRSKSLIKKLSKLLGVD